MIAIPTYNEINDLHILTGSHLRSKDPLFHCFDMSETNDLTVTELPPHRSNFYTLALNFNTKALNYSLNANDFHNPETFLLCVAPGQIAKWEKKGNWYGYCVFFKKEFLNFRSEINFLDQFPFFSINETNLLPIRDEHFKTVSMLFRQIISEDQSSSTFSAEIIRSNFQAVLWHVRRIYEAVKTHTPEGRANDIITSQFHYLVNEHFLTKSSVEEYAEMLNITPNHLSQTIKNTTGNTAKSYITNRRVEEARYLLKYTKVDVSEIAFHLGFSEATHFSKVFKAVTNLTPLEYRATQ